MLAVPEQSARLVLELYEVREGRYTGPGVLGGGAQGQEDLAELVQVRVPGQEGNLEEGLNI